MAEQLDGTRPQIGIHSLGKSGRVLKALAYMYMPMYGLGVEFLFANYRVLGGVAALFYEADEENERKGGNPGRKLGTLRTFLANEQLLDESIEAFVQQGEDYLCFERATRQGHKFDAAQLIDAVEKRSADFRVLHSILLTLTEQTRQQRVFEVYASFEALFEIEDDLKSYHDDKAANSFNTACYLEKLFPVQSGIELERILKRFTGSMKMSQQQLREPFASRFNQILVWYRNEVGEAVIPLPLD